MKPDEIEAAAKRVLAATADLLAKRGAWTQGVMARTKHDWAVHPTAPAAVCWCAVGGMRKVSREMRLGSDLLAVDRVAQEKLAAVIENPNREPQIAIMSFNDKSRRRKRDVIQAFRKAAA